MPGSKTHRCYESVLLLASRPAGGAWMVILHICRPPTNPHHNVISRFQCRASSFFPPTICPPRIFPSRVLNRFCFVLEDTGGSVISVRPLLPPLLAFEASIGPETLLGLDVQSFGSGPPLFVTCEPQSLRWPELLSTTLSISATPPQLCHHLRHSHQYSGLILCPVMS